MEAERLEVEECLVDGCLALKTVDCLMEKKRHCETGGAQGMFLYLPDDRVLPETLVVITMPHAHTAYMQCGKADSTTSRGMIPKQTLGLSVRPPVHKLGA